MHGFNAASDLIENLQELLKGKACVQAGQSVTGAPSSAHCAQQPDRMPAAADARPLGSVRLVVASRRL